MEYALVFPQQAVACCICVSVRARQQRSPDAVEVSRPCLTLGASPRVIVLQYHNDAFDEVYSKADRYSASTSLLFVWTRNDNNKS
jgi:hypothetical protein